MVTRWLDFTKLVFGEVWSDLEMLFKVTHTLNEQIIFTKKKKLNNRNQ